MTKTKKALALVAIVGGIVVLAHSRTQTKQVGMVIGIKPENIAAYKALHAASNPGVRDLLSRYHMKNFSIYLQRLDDGNYYLFGYYEYDGSDYAGDMIKLATAKCTAYAAGGQHRGNVILCAARPDLGVRVRPPLLPDRLRICLSLSSRCLNAAGRSLLLLSFR